MAPRKTAVATAPAPAVKTSVPRLRSVKFKEGYAGADRTQGLRAMYEAAGTNRRAVDAFKHANGWSAEYLLGKTLDVVQRRVLHEVRNNPIAGRIVDVIVRTTLGTGLTPKISDPVLRKLWKRWCKQAGADGRLTFDGLMSLAMREVAVKGEVFMRHREREKRDVDEGFCSLPYQVQLITSEFCPLTRPGETLSTEPADDFRSGIFFNPNIGRREAYLFLTKHPRGGTTATSTLLETTAVPAAKVMHVFQDREGGQLRGEPWLVRSLIRLHELDEYMDAELAKKKSAAKLTTFYKSPEAKVGQEMITDADGNLVPVADDTSFVPDRIDAGAQMILPPGWSVENHRASEVGGDFEVFTRKVLMEACAAAHAPYELVTGDFSLTQERMLRFFYKTTYEQTVAARREMLISQAAAPIFRRFVQEAFLYGAWTPPAGETWEDHAEPEWAGMPMPYPNILQEYNAKAVAIKEGMQSLSGAIREFGRDPDEVAQEMRDDLVRFEGLPVSMILAKLAPTAVPQNPNGDTYPPQQDQEPTQ